MTMMIFELSRCRLFYYSIQKKRFFFCHQKITLIHMRKNKNEHTTAETWNPNFPSFFVLYNFLQQQQQQ